MRYIFLSSEETGKTFLVKECFNGFKIVNFGSKNEYNSDKYTVITEKDFLLFLEELISTKDIVIDIDKEYYQFIKEELEFIEPEEFLQTADCFVIPVIPSKKAQEAGIKTFELLKSVNALEDGRVILVYNKCKKTVPAEKSFKIIHNYLNKNGITPVILKVEEFNGDVIENIYRQNKTVREFSQIQEDFLQKAEDELNSGNKEKAAEFVTLAYWKMNSQKIVKKLQNLFKREQ